MALETFELRKELAKTRKELSTALYHHDAAVRVVARLTKERNEARDALAKLSVSIGTVQPTETSADSEKSDDITEEPKAVEIPQSIVELITAKQQELTPLRRKRKNAPEGWTTSEQLANFKQLSHTKQLFTTVSALTIDPATKKYLLTGGGKSQAGIFSIESQKLTSTISASGIITGAAWTTTNLIVVGTKTGFVDVFESVDESKVEKTGSIDLSSQGKIINIKAHPVGSLLVALTEQSLNLINLEDASLIASLNSGENSTYTSLAVHPDGVLVAVGTEDGAIYFHNLTAGGSVSTSLRLTEPGAVSALEFSENGYWLVSGSVNGSAQVWDLRKLTQVAEIGFEQVKGPVLSLAMDYSGQFLAAGNAKGVEVVAYIKAKKSWTETPVFVAGNPTVDLTWGVNGASLYTVSAKGNITSYGLNTEDDVEME